MSTKKRKQPVVDHVAFAREAVVNTALAAFDAEVRWARQQEAALREGRLSELHDRLNAGAATVGKRRREAHDAAAHLHSLINPKGARWQ